MSDRRCLGCNRALIPESAWRKLPPAERATLRAQGHTAHASRGLCGTCRWRHAKRDTLADVPRATHPAQDVIDDWQALRDEWAGMSRNQACKTLAHRLGMTPKALERALLRAGWTADKTAP